MCPVIVEMSYTNYRPSQKNDLAFGIKSETEIVPSLEKFFDTTLNHNGGYAVMDWSNPTKTIFVELKTRRIPHNRYDTALIGKNKVDFCNDENKEYYFCFNYTDGVFYIKYDKQLFSTFANNDNFVRGERTDCSNNPQSIVYIPSNLLVKF